MVDKTLVLRKLAEIDQYLLQVKEYAGISLEQYESSWKTQRIIERTLQMMIETCVDIAGHIISVMILRVSRQQLFRYWNKTMRRDRRRSQQIPRINFPFMFSCFLSFACPVESTKGQRGVFHWDVFVIVFLPFVIWILTFTPLDN